MSKFQECHFNYYVLTCSKILTIFQIVELQSPSLSAHLTVGVNGGSSMGSILSHDDGLDSAAVCDQGTQHDFSSAAVICHLSVVAHIRFLHLQLMSTPPPPLPPYSIQIFDSI